MVGLEDLYRELINSLKQIPSPIRPNEGAINKRYVKLF